MNQFLSIFINILIFLLSLGALIVIHELGHFTTAKIFKVYCYEFSVGMGPAIYKHKRKKGETTFAIRCLPLGGYVAMAGEDMDDGEEDLDTTEVKVPKERTIEGIARWKRIIIMGAGVFLNFVLGYVLFFINYAAVPQLNVTPESTKIYIPTPKEGEKGGLAYEAGLRDGDEVKEMSIIYHYTDRTTNEPIDFEILNQEVKVYGYEKEVPLDQLNYSISNLLNGQYYNGSEVINLLPSKANEDYRLVFFTYERDGVIYTNGIEGEFEKSKMDSYNQIKSVAEVRKEQGEDVLLYSLINMGVGREEIRFSFGEAFAVAGKQWATACGAIFVGLGQLFTPAGWAQTGGIISIFKISMMSVSQGLASVLNLWGIISVNLGIMNLLPFPGLDGWQIFVTAAEGITRKEIPNKVKNIVSTVGLILLIGLSIALIVKDIVAPAI